MDDQTVQYYNRHAEKYSSDTFAADMSLCRERFLRYLQQGARILDAGCGSGRDTLAFKQAGYDVDAFDASKALCEIASQNTGIEVRHLRFEELSGRDEYDGIWACASLIHVDRGELPDVLERLHLLLREHGILYASFKYGESERNEGTRYFCDLSEKSGRELMESAGFDVLEIFKTSDVRTGHEDEQWINIIAGN